MLARVIEVLADRFKVATVESNNIKYVKSRGKIKKDSYIKVGDLVNLSETNGEYIIDAIEERKNDYIRPPVANIDYMFIVIAAGSPKPDYLLLDKQLITTEYNKCKPIIVVNKSDLKDSEEIIKYVKETYSKIGYRVIITNTIDNDLLNEIEFKKVAAGALCTFSGNSGVGKSSIINKLVGEEIELETNAISEKTGKGRHTTKAVTTYRVLNDKNEAIYFLDTPGFSSYDIYNIESKDLKHYYNEFTNPKCEYDDCNHVHEDVKHCSVKKAIQQGKIDSKRYENYIKIYEELKQKEKRIYK